MCCSMHCLIVYCWSSGQKKRSLLPIIGLFTANFHLVFSIVPLHCLHFLYKMKRDLLIGFLVGIAGIVTVVGLAFGLVRVLNSEDGSSASRLQGMFGILPIDSWLKNGLSIEQVIAVENWKSVERVTQTTSIKR